MDDRSRYAGIALRCSSFQNVNCQVAMLALATRMDICNLRWIAGSALLCAILIYVYPLTLSTPLLDPDEGLHAAISQRMVESGDYVIPRFLDKPFLDKPIFYFVAQALSLRFFGMHEAAVRLPGLMFALLSALTTSLLARRLFDTTTGWLALLVVLTLVIPASLAQAAAHDVALVPWTNLLLLCLWETDRDTCWRRRAAFTTGAALCVALAVLTKGLIGIAVVATGYGLSLLVLQQFNPATLARGLVSFAGGMLLASPWFIAMEVQVPGYLHYYFVERHLQGFATTTQQHGHQPWYFYLPLVLAGTVPWCVYLVPGLWQYTIDRKNTDRAADNRATLFLWCWLVGGLVFLSAANSKLITYSLPLFPAIAILIGHVWKRFLLGELAPTVQRVFGLLFLLCCFVGGFVPLGVLIGFDRFNDIRSPASAYVVAAVGSATMVAAILLFLRDKRTSALAIGSQVFALLFVTVVTWPLQPLAERLSQRQLARDFAQQGTLPKRILFGGGRAASVVFYLEPDQRLQLNAGQIAAAEFQEVHKWTCIPQGTLLVVRADAWAHWPNVPFQKSARVRNVGSFCVVNTAGDAGEVADNAEAMDAHQRR